jgi:hypothetical protein
MSEHKKQDETQVPGGKPSQAEGERDPGSTGQSEQPAPGKPSQAEGDRETIEEKLGES